jgi:predicted Fe-S protein YdhL (DUF1289 family)
MIGPAFKPGGIRQRAYKAVLRRGQCFDNAERTRASIAYWDSQLDDAQRAVLAEARSRRRKRERDAQQVS